MRLSPYMLNVYFLDRPAFEIDSYIIPIKRTRHNVLPPNAIMNITITITSGYIRYCLHPLTVLSNESGTTYPAKANSIHTRLHCALSLLHPPSESPVCHVTRPRLTARRIRADSKRTAVSKSYLLASAIISSDGIVLLLPSPAPVHVPLLRRRVWISGLGIDPSRRPGE